MSLGSKLAFLKQKKYLISLILFLVSFILFFPSANLVLDMDILGSASGNLTYVTPFEAQYKFSTPSYFILDDKSPNIKLHINGRTVKKVQMIIHDFSSDFTYNIKKAGIKFWYLPVFYFDMSKTSINKDNIHHVIEFQDISIFVIIIPVILILIMVISFIVFAYDFTNNFYKNNKESIKDNTLIYGILIFIILLEYIKINTVKIFFATELIEHNNFLVILQIIKYDSFFILVMLMLFYTALKIKSRYITYLALFLVCGLSFLYAVDIALIVLFNSRLVLLGGGTGQLMPDINTIYNMGKALLNKNVGIYVYLLLIYTFVFTIFIAMKKDLYRYTKTGSIIIVVTAVCLTTLIFLSDFIGFYRHKIMYSNLISVNFINTYTKPYSAEKIKSLKKDFSYKYTCEQGLNTRKNVIVILIESLSSYKSDLFSGLENKVPNIDMLAKNNTYLSSYYGNGANSQLGLYSLLTGKHGVTSNNVLENRLSYKDSIPMLFSKSGYKTVLYSGANITYASANKIGEYSGMKEIYDTIFNSVYPENEKQYIFRGVDDTVLYSSIFKWYEKEENKKQPFFMVVKTLTTHQPYVDPLSKQQSFNKTLKFADKAIKEFAEQLEKAGYFNSGILVITGDHRAMLPVSENEYEKLGPLAHAAIPLVIIDGSNNKKEIKGPYSHTDLGKSLAYLTLDKVCFNQFQKNIFKEQENGCVIYQQMMDMGIIDVRCGDTYGQIQLEGDNTRFIKDNLNISPEEKEDIIDYINYLRVTQ